MTRPLPDQRSFLRATDTTMGVYTPNPIPKKGTEPMNPLSVETIAQLRAFLAELQTELAKPAAAPYEKEHRLLELLGQLIEKFGPVFLQLLLDLMAQQH